MASGAKVLAARSEPGIAPEDLAAAELEEFQRGAGVFGGEDRGAGDEEGVELGREAGAELECGRGSGGVGADADGDRGGLGAGSLKSLIRESTVVRARPTYRVRFCLCLALLRACFLHFT